MLLMEFATYAKARINEMETFFQVVRTSEHQLCKTNIKNLNNGENRT